MSHVVAFNHMALAARNEPRVAAGLLSSAVANDGNCRRHLVDQRLRQIRRQRHDPDAAGVVAELEENQRRRRLSVPTVSDADTDDSITLCHACDIHRWSLALADRSYPRRPTPAAGRPSRQPDQPADSKALSIASIASTSSRSPSRLNWNCNDSLSAGSGADPLDSAPSAHTACFRRAARWVPSTGATREPATHRRFVYAHQSHLSRSGRRRHCAALSRDG